MTPTEIAANREMLTHVGVWLRFRGKTQRQLAEHLGVSEPTVSKWLRGGQSVTTTQFTAIARFLSADPAEVMGAPMDRETSRRYKMVAEMMQQMSPETLATWLAVGKKMLPEKPD